jgi:hypothetical protein
MLRQQRLGRQNILALAGWLPTRIQANAATGVNPCRAST